MKLPAGIRGRSIEKKLLVRVRSGDLRAAYELGVNYLRVTGPKRREATQAAKRFLLKAARGGIPDASFELGQQYEDIGRFGNRPRLAIRWYRIAARGGHVGAFNSIGFYYEHGMGVKRSLKKAVAYYLQGAKRGDVLAQYNLAKCYLIGEG